MLRLGSQSLVVASSKDDQYMLEIIDPLNHFARVEKVLTFHSGTITSMVEHNEMLLTGSLDSSIGIWDLENEL